MARTNAIIGAFTSGELTPKLFGRIDLEKYLTGLATLVNYIIQPQGGLYRRSGTIYSSEVKTSANYTWLIPFIVGQLASYMIEAGNAYFRFYVNFSPLKIGSTPVEVVTPYLTADLPLLDYAQSANTLFLVHPTYAPQFLQRNSSTSFSLQPFAYTDGPYMDLNQDSTKTLTPSGFTSHSITDPYGTGTITVYDGTGTITAVGHTPFVSSDVGRWIRIRHSARWGACQITAFTSSSVVTAKVYSWNGGLGGFPFLQQAASQDWRLGSWSVSTGWPSTVSFHEGRLTFANTPTEPQGTWMSKSAVFNIFSPTQPDVTVTDDDGIGYTINSNQSNPVQWIMSARSLMLGTVGSEFAVRTSSTSLPITPTNIAFQQQSTKGSAKVKPFLIGTSIIYVQRCLRKLFEQTYDWSNDGWNSVELSLLSEHLLREGGGIVQTTFQQIPDSIWWAARADGTLIGMTYMKDQKIVGFHRHIIGGTFNGGQAVVESVATIPHPDGSQDQLWMIVKRTINGVTKRYVEYLDKPFDTDSNKLSMNFVDCGFYYSGAPITHVTGLGPLNGQVLTLCGNGSVMPQRIVASDGTIDVATSVSTLFAGLGFMSQLMTMPCPEQGDAGTGQGKIKRIDRIYARFLRTLGGKMGPSFDKLKIIPFATTSTTLDNSPDLFTGDKEIYFNAQYDYLGQFCIQQDLPYPMNILAFMPQLVIQP